MLVAFPCILPTNAVADTIACTTNQEGRLPNMKRCQYAR